MFLTGRKLKEIETLVHGQRKQLEREIDILCKAVDRQNKLIKKQNKRLQENKDLLLSLHNKLDDTYNLNPSGDFSNLSITQAQQLEELQQRLDSTAGQILDGTNPVKLEGT